MKPWKLFLGSAVAATVLLGSIPTAQAQRWDACSARIDKDQQDVNHAIYRYGYYSRQAQHEQDELQRDSAECGYDIYGYRIYRDRDDRRYRNGGGYYDAASDNGYRDGLVMGERDAQRNRAFRPSKNDWYEDADHGYERAHGDKGSYKFRYRQAFEQGYSEGYQRWR